jgi:hypothetical protein
MRIIIVSIIAACTITFGALVFNAAHNLTSAVSAHTSATNSAINEAFSGR